MQKKSVLILGLVGILLTVVMYFPKGANVLSETNPGFSPIIAPHASGNTTVTFSNSTQSNPEKLYQLLPSTVNVSSLTLVNGTKNNTNYANPTLFTSYKNSTGIYPATDGFDNGWDSWIGGYILSNVRYDGDVTQNASRQTASSGGHSGYLRMEDGTADTKSATLYRSFSSVLPAFAYVEFWVRTNNTNKYKGFVFNNGNPITGTSCWYFYLFNDGRIVVRNGASETTVVPYQANTWIHIKIGFKTATFKANLTVNGTYYGEYSFQNNLAINNMRLYFLSNPSRVEIDAVGQSFIAPYTVGQNLNEYLPRGVYATFGVNSSTLSLSQFYNLTVTTKWKTNISQTVSIAGYNYEKSAWEAMLAGSHTIFTTHTYVRNNRTQSYFNTSSCLTFALRATNSTSPFTLTLESFTVLIYYINQTQLAISPSLSVVFESRIEIGRSNNISVCVSPSLNAIKTVKFWSNLSGVNETLGTTDGVYSKLITVNTTQFYSVQIYVDDVMGSWRKCVVNDIEVKALSNTNIFNNYTTVNTTINNDLPVFTQPVYILIILTVVTLVICNIYSKNGPLHLVLLLGNVWIFGSTYSYDEDSTQTFSTFLFLLNTFICVLYLTVDYKNRKRSSD